MLRLGSQNVWGVCATIGGILIHLTLGNLYSFGKKLKSYWFICQSKSAQPSYDQHFSNCLVMKCSDYLLSLKLWNVCTVIIMCRCIIFAVYSACLQVTWWLTWCHTCTRGLTPPSPMPTFCGSIALLPQRRGSLWYWEDCWRRELDLASPASSVAPYSGGKAKESSRVVKNYYPFTTNARVD